MNTDTAIQTVAIWQGPNIAFWMITLLVLGSGAVAALSRSIVVAAFSLFFTLLGMAGYYVLLGSSFLAVTQVIIYVGGILVLLMFGILLTARPMQRDPKDTHWLYLLAGTLSAALFVVLAHLIWTVPWRAGPIQNPPAGDVRPIGHALLTTYLLPFEVAGMTLLLCLVGAAYLVRRRER